MTGSLANQSDQPGQKLQFSVVGGSTDCLVAEKFILPTIFQRLEARHHLGAVIADLPIPVRLRIQDGEVYCVAESREIKG